MKISVERRGLGTNLMMGMKTNLCLIFLCVVCCSPLQSWQCCGGDVMVCRTVQNALITILIREEQLWIMIGSLLLFFFFFCGATAKRWSGDRDTSSSLMRQQTAAEAHQHSSYSCISLPGFFFFFQPAAKCCERWKSRDWGATEALPKEAFCIISGLWLPKGKNKECTLTELLLSSASSEAFIFPFAPYACVLSLFLPSRCDAELRELSNYQNGAATGSCAQLWLLK